MPTEQDIKRYCRCQGFLYSRLGCPADWTRTDVFWVIHTSKLKAWTENGSALPIELVEKWLAEESGAT